MLKLSSNVDCLQTFTSFPMIDITQVRTGAFLSRAPDNYFFVGSKCTLSLKNEGVKYSIISNPGSKCTLQFNNQV